MRLDRWLVARSLGSRKEVHRLLRRGLIRVDGEVVRERAFALPESASVEFDGRLLEVPPLLLAFHKPAGVHCSRRDPHGRADLAGIAPEHHPVGRLDAETEGLLLFSREGALTQWMLHPRRALEREYQAQVHQPVTEILKEKLAAGVETAAGIFRADLLEFEGEMLRVVVREGRHRMVRRMLHNAGWSVLKLRRLRFGEIRLGTLPPGELRPLSPEELAWVEALRS